MMFWKSKNTETVKGSVLGRDSKKEGVEHREPRGLEVNENTLYSTLHVLSRQMRDLV